MEKENSTTAIGVFAICTIKHKASNNAYLVKTSKPIKHDRLKYTLKPRVAYFNNFMQANWTIINSDLRTFTLAHGPFKLDDFEVMDITNDLSESEALAGLMRLKRTCWVANITVLNKHFK